MEILGIVTLRLIHFFQDKATSVPASSSSKMKAVEARDFFASSSAAAAPAAKKKKVVSPNENKGARANGKSGEADVAASKEKKRKSPDVEFHDDPDFAAMLVDMDVNPGMAFCHGFL